MTDPFKVTKLALLYEQAHTRYNSRTHPPTTPGECQDRQAELAERVYQCGKCKAKFLMSESPFWKWVPALQPRGAYKLSNVTCPHCGYDLCRPAFPGLFKPDPHLQKVIIDFLGDNSRLAYTISDLMVHIQIKRRTQMMNELALLHSQKKIQRRFNANKYFYAANHKTTVVSRSSELEIS